VAPNIVGEWSSTKSSTEHTLRMLETYKQIGDSSDEVSGGQRWAFQ
jgi:hypothetical protein